MGYQVYLSSHKQLIIKTVQWEHLQF